MRDLSIATLYNNFTYITVRVSKANGSKTTNTQLNNSLAKSIELLNHKESQVDVMFNSHMN